MPRRKNTTPATPGRDCVPQPPRDPNERNLAADFDRLAAELRARNLHNAVLLAQQAACGHGPLVDHFCELGRVWGWRLLTDPAKTRRKSLRVIEGGQADG